ncbi:MAG TPA: T9SS type A sorting domain-containing protein, partial [Bacteroidetes bacterium]|nr:T9SS type A sorting domain-containing protein [Bacteroidota bacterium]
SPAPDAGNLTIARLDDEGRWLAVQTWRSGNSSVLTAEVSQTGTYALLKSSAAVRAEQDDLPRSYSLQQNFPNPFNPETRIAFALPEKTAVRLRIYTVTGQVIATLVDGELDAGTYEYTWNGKSILGRDVPSGVYFYEIETSQFRQVKKMTLIR